MSDHARRTTAFAAALLVATTLGGGASAIAQDDPAASAAASPVPGASPVAGAEPRHIDLALTSRLQILDRSGAPVRAIAVRPGETLEIGVANQARFAHNLFIGTHDALAAGQTEGLPGVDPFAGGYHAFLWTVPADVTGLWFGCTVVGHFSLMQGRIVAVADFMPDLSGLSEADAVALLDASGLLNVERTSTPDPSVPAGTVLAQEPAAGATIDPTTIVRLTIAGDPDASPAA